MNSELDLAESHIVSIPDYPQPGVVFRDVMPLLANGDDLRAVVDAMVAPFAGQYDAVAGIEARGFLFAGAAAAMTGVGLVPIRKAGKLPRPAASAAYELEYGNAVIEMHDDVPPGTRLLVMDDVLATGGTLAAAIELVTTIGCDPIGVTALLELESLGGRGRLGTAVPVHTLFLG